MLSLQHIKAGCFQRTSEKRVLVVTIKSASEQYTRLWQIKSGLVNQKIELQFSQHLTEHLWVHYSWEEVQTCKHIPGIWTWKPGQDSIFSPKCPEVFNASHKSVSHSPFLSPANSTCLVCAFQSSDSLESRSITGKVRRSFTMNRH